MSGGRGRPTGPVEGRAGLDKGRSAAPESPVLPAHSADETDARWGEPPVADPDDLERFLRERPPHHGD